MYLTAYKALYKIVVSKPKIILNKNLKLLFIELNPLKILWLNLNKVQIVEKIIPIIIINYLVKNL